MALTDMPFFAKMKAKMQWHQSRQRVLSENVANADTPGYRARDLKALDFSKVMAEAAPSGFSTAVTDRQHIKVAGLGGTGAFKSQKTGTFEITPEGNRVVLEEEMMKVTANQMDFQAAASLYERGLKMLKTAVTRR
ncbi:flagellar basal body rod protein FlgB [Coralliovum pocilloporae]|uniref:flagellar basal body rod protein FlgB n=1 Tax=Coralliovum pocilloporae TaxID=3066369 RepID=UPI003307778C